MIFKFTNVDYIVKMMDNLPEYMKGESETHHPFEMDDETTHLSRDYTDKFHHFFPNCCIFQGYLDQSYSLL